MTGPSESTLQAEPDALARALMVLGSGTRLRVLHHLSEPAYVRDLVRGLHLTRQAIARHLEELMSVGLVEAERGHRRGALPATRYVVSPSGLFAFKESIRALALRAPMVSDAPAATRRAVPGQLARSGSGPGLLMVYGDVPGRWFSLHAGTSWIVGRDPKADVCLSYDPFASTRHVHLQHAGGRWTVTDLHSTNRTLLNFRPMHSGEERPFTLGDLLTVGKSHLLFRDS